jgi:hypothetical protein
MRALIFVALLASVAHADTLGPQPTDAGKVTAIRRGVWEIDLDSLGVLTVDRAGDAGSATQLAMTSSAGVHYFVADNISVGVQALASYAQVTGTGSDLMLGGAVDAGLHLRLGLGAFLRPRLALGVLTGRRELPGSGSTRTTVDQLGGIARLGMPVAYFVGRRVVLQAGPELVMTLGSFEEGMSEKRTSFVRVAGGFALGIGYAF